MRCVLVAAVVTLVATAMLAQVWTPPDRKDAPFSVDTSSGKIHLTYNQTHLYQHAYMVGMIYGGGTATTEYLEIFDKPLDKPAATIGWRDRGAIFLYVMPVADWRSSDGSKVEVKTNGTNFLIVIYYPAHGPDTVAAVVASQ